MHRSALKKKVDDLEAEIQIITGTAEKTAIGVVHVDGHLIRTIKNVGGQYIEVDEEPKAFIAEKLEPMYTRPKRFIIVIGGRGSSKSLGAGDYVAINIHDSGESWLCLREFQSSIADSVHELLKSEISRIGLDGFDVTDKTIRSSTGGKARFNGLSRNPESVKSAFGFNGFWSEEAQSLSLKSIRMLTPTGRNKPFNGLPKDFFKAQEGDDEIEGLETVRQIFCANPGSSQDPFSKRFINPFKAELDRNGIYEDDLHLIIKMNWQDNPWFEMSGLDSERLFDYKNLPRAIYDHIWEGEFNDSVENAIIPAEWFDACIDAHEKLGYKPTGAKIVCHDPSDLGPDPKGLAYRHGSVLLDVIENENGDVNEGCDWAVDYALREGADTFGWDAGGMGVTLKRQVDHSLEGKRTDGVMFNGAETAFRPDSIYQPAEKSIIRNAGTNRDVFANKRAQCYWYLRDRVYNTYRAVIHGEYVNPDEMISFSSTIKNMPKLRAEVCRIPLKPNGNGKIQIMTKDEMRKIGIPSPNLADSVMMTMAENNVIKKKKQPVAPPLKPTMRQR